MSGVPVLSHRVRGPGASNKLKSIFCSGVHVAKNTLCGASLGPEELASADPTVLLSGQCRRLAMPAKARSAARPTRLNQKAQPFGLIEVLHRLLQDLCGDGAGGAGTATAVFDEHDEGQRVLAVIQKAHEPCVR